MLAPNLLSRIRDRVRDRSVRAAVALFVGLNLIATAIVLMLRNSGMSEGNSRTLQAPLAVSPGPVASISAIPHETGKFPTPTKQLAVNPEELGQTLEEFQAEYEALSGKVAGQEVFFKKSLGKNVTWTVRVDHVFRTGLGVIVVFSSTERPDWAAFPISDARFPIQMEKQLMALSRGDIIKLKGRIVDQGIKTLEGSSFEVLSSAGQNHVQ